MVHITYCINILHSNDIDYYIVLSYIYFCDLMFSQGCFYSLNG